MISVLTKVPYIFYTYQKDILVDTSRYFTEKNVRTNINVVLAIANKLRDVGRPLPANLIIGKIISSLPESFARVRTVWEGTPIVERTLENLQSRLIAEEKTIAAYKAESAHNNTVAYHASGTILEIKER